MFPDTYLNISIDHLFDDAVIKLNKMHIMREKQQFNEKQFNGIKKTRWIDPNTSQEEMKKRFGDTFYEIDNNLMLQMTKQICVALLHITKKKLLIIFFL